MAITDKINGYLNERTSGTILGTEYLDLDATDDLGVTYDSNKLTIDNLVDYINDNVDNIYSVDGALTGHRTIDMAGFRAIWEDGNIILKSELSDIGYTLWNTLTQERGSFKHNVSLDSGELSLINSSGQYFYASDGKVGIHASTPLYGLDMIFDDVTNIPRVRNAADTAFIEMGSISGAGTMNPRLKARSSVNGLGVVINGDLSSGQDVLGSSAYMASTAIRCTKDGGATELVNARMFTISNFINPVMAIMANDSVLFESTGSNHDGTPTEHFEIRLNPSKNILTSTVAATVLSQIQNSATHIIRGEQWDGASTSSFDTTQRTIIDTAGGSPTGKFRTTVLGTTILDLKESGVVNMPNIPTSSVGLVTGDLWNNSGIINII